MVTVFTAGVFSKKHQHFGMAYAHMNVKRPHQSNNN
jgi:hypothetical protein